MAERDFRVRVTADTKQAQENLGAVENSISRLTKKNTNIGLNIDANAVKQTNEQTREIAENFKRTKASIQEASGINIVSPSSLAGATTLAGTFYGLRKDIGGLQGDLGRALGKTNVSEFMRTDQFLDRVLESSRSSSRQIIETYKNIRELPGTADLLGPVENFARAKAWDEFGGQIADQTLQGVQRGLQQSVKATKGFFYADLLDEVGASANQTINTLARVGLAIQGVQLLVGPLAATWKAAFNAIIGQNVRLEQTILSTQTTLASTARVFEGGREVSDPLQKIQALEGGVREAIENIRIRSLDLAGVTSQQIVDIFGVVATSISQVDGDIKDAEDLAISFTAALGTLGVPFYQARQEIGSILGGYITEDSLLAKRLQISNQDIRQAKSSVDGVVGYLQKKLEVAVAGQAIQAKGFAGVLSNIQEVFEVIAQRVGQPLLQPIIGGLTLIYNFLSKIQGVLTEVGNFISSSIAKTVNGIANIFRETKLAEAIGRFTEQLSRPYDQLRRALELGFADQGGNLFEGWINSTEQVPAVMQGVVSALQSFGNFLRLQIDLINEPLKQLIDQTRELRGAGDIAGVAQGIARVASTPFGNFIELGDVFTKGWDTIGSTIAYAASSLSKFAVAIARLKITELTATIRAAASVFEMFGSIILGKVNLAISFFEFLGNVASTDLAKFLVTMSAINKLVNSTDFFGAKGILNWALQTRVILRQLAGDIKLFVKGFRDANNIEGLLGNTQNAYAKVFNIGNKSGNSVIQNATQVEQMTQRIASLNAMQTQMAAQGAGAVAMERYGKAITGANEQLAALKKTQQEFTATQRAGAALKSVLGGGAEMTQAKEAARQASVLASGAASAQALSGAMDALATKLGMTKEQFKSLGGVAQAAGKSIRIFMTSTLLINVGFAALSLAISGIIALWQSYEERARKARLETQATSAVLRVLGREYTGLLKAAEGGDIAARNLIDAEREQIQSKVQIQAEKLAKIAEKEADVNNELARSQSRVNELRKKGVQLAGPDEGVAGTSQDELRFNLERINVLNKERNKLGAERNAQLQSQLQAQEALQKLERQEASNKQVKVLAQQRKEVEEKIKVFREDLNKEINDKEFQQRMELLNNEQQIKSAQIQAQKQALSAEFELIRSNSTERNQASLKLIEDYKQGLLDATESEERRRIELLQAEGRMKKDIEDYAFKIGRQRAALEKTIGKHKQDVQKEVNKQQSFADEKALVAAKKRTALLSAFFRPFSAAQNQQFINYTQGNNPSGKKYSLEMAYGVGQTVSKDALGIAGYEPGDFIAAKVVVYLERLAKQGITTLEQLVKATNPDLDAAGVTQIVRALQAEQNRRMGIDQLRNPTPPITNKEFDKNYQRDLSNAEQTQRKLATEQLASLKQVMEAQAKNEQNKLEGILNQFANPSRFGNIKSSYTTDIEANARELRIATAELDNFGKGLSTVDTEIERATTVLRTQLFNMLRTTYKKKDDNEIKSLVDTVIKAGGAASGPRPEQKALAAMVNALFEGFNAYVQQARNNAGPAQDAAQGQSINQALEQSLSQTNLIANRSNRLGEAFQKLSSIVDQSKTDIYSFAQRQKEVGMFVQSEIAKILANQKTPISAEQLESISKHARTYTDLLIQQEEAMRPANEALQQFSDRMSMAVRGTDAFMGANKTFMQSILTNSQSLEEASTQLLTSISEEFVSMFLDYAMRPMREQIMEQMKSLFGVNTAEDQAKALLSAGTNLSGAATSLGTSATAITDAANRLGQNAIAGGVATNPASALPSAASSITNLYSPGGGASAVAPLEGAQDYSDALKNSAESIKAQGYEASQTAPKTNDWGKALGGATQALGSVAMGITGAQQMSEGGTYNVLMGLAGIFGALGSITGMFGTGGIFAGKKASGGPVRANRPYLVGEIGPELFLPNSDGEIVSNAKSRKLMSAAALAGKSQTFASNSGARQKATPSNLQFDFAYQSEVINNVEYVTTDQFRKGMSDSAERGKNMAFQFMQNNVSTRRRLGL
jgi:hypothetical protein